MSADPNHSPTSVGSVLDALGVLQSAKPQTLDWLVAKMNYMAAFHAMDGPSPVSSEYALIRDCLSELGELRAEAERSEQR